MVQQIFSFSNFVNFSNVVITPCGAESVEYGIWSKTVAETVFVSKIQSLQFCSTSWSTGPLEYFMLDQIQRNTPYFLRDFLILATLVVQFFSITILIFLILAALHEVPSHLNILSPIKFQGKHCITSVISWIWQLSKFLKIMFA